MIELLRFQDASFWKYNTIGWGIVFLFRVGAILLIFKSYSFTSVSINVLIIFYETFIGFIFSLLLWMIYRRFYRTEMNIVQVIGIAGGISLVFTFGWTLLNSMGDGVIVECCGYQSKSLTFPSYLRAVATNYPYLFVWSVLYFGIRFLQEWECERQRAEEAIAAAQQTQLQTLRYHLNPHFLFNALNSIRALVDENSKEARTLVTALSEFLRYSLVSRNQKVVSLKEEMDAIRNYLQVEKRRYEDKLEVTYDIDARTENLPILSFLIQPLVENAVKYGMQTSPMPLRITFRSLVENGNLKFLIINTGTWFTQDQNNIEPMTFPSGLMNVKKRLEASYPNAHNLSHYELDGCVCISLEISTIQSESDEEKDKSVNR